MLYLRFSKAIKLTFSSFVYYIWKTLFLQSVLKCAERFAIPAFLEGNLSTLTLACKKRTPLLRRPPSGCFLHESTSAGASFNSEFCEIFKNTYFEEYLRTGASENVFMKLRKVKI